MKKIWSGAVLTILVMLLSGCIFRTPDELYQLPQRSPGYEELTKTINEVKRDLELEFPGTAVEPAVVYSGDNTSNIQLQDLDSDGEPETAVTFLRVPGAELPLRIYFFTKQPDGSYEVSCVVEGTGTAIYAVDYEELSGGGKKELVVSWRTSTNMYHLGVYSLENANQNQLEQSTDKPLSKPIVRTLPEATELMTTTYSGYSLLDIDQDTLTELAVVRIDSTGTNNLVELYGWQDGTFASLGTARLSSGITLTRVRANFVTDRISALYITGSRMDSGQSTDIVVWRNGRLVNLTMNPETGVSNETIQGYIIDPSDVNNDTILEIPRPHLLPSFREGISSNWLINWTQYNQRGRAAKVFTTYHNIIDNLYFEIPDFWVEQITLGRDDSVSGERAVVFYHWNGPEKEPTPFLVIYKLTGINRTIRAAQAGRFILSEDDSTIYAASLLASKWDCGLDESDVLDRFHRATSGWSNE